MQQVAKMLHLRASCFIHRLSDPLYLPPSVYTNRTGNISRGLFTAIFVVSLIIYATGGGCRLRLLFDLNVVVHLHHRLGSNWFFFHINVLPTSFSVGAGEVFSLWGLGIPQASLRLRLSWTQEPAWQRPSLSDTANHLWRNGGDQVGEL